MNLTPLKQSLALVFALALSACANHGGSGSYHSGARASIQLTEQEQVKQRVVTMVNAIDNKQWELASAQFKDRVFVDYSSLSGQPGAETDASQLVGGWRDLLARVETLHQLSNFDVAIDGDRAQVSSHVYASHQAEGVEGYWDAYGRYQHELERIDGAWKISSMTLIMHGQKGNTNFLSEVMAKKATATSYRENYQPNKKYPAVVVSGSWTTVKEQMVGLYAERLAGEDFITLAFDFRNFGESEGTPRFS